MPTFQITVYHTNNATGSIELQSLPDECPYCHNKITPEYKLGFIRHNSVQAILVCGNHDCEKAFIAYYNKDGNHKYNLQSISKGSHKPISIPNVITEISPSFDKIYKEAHFAEEEKLIEICGVGYRKSLEFLIKDYLIKLYPDKKEKIEKKFLGNCIKEYVENQQIKNVSLRAAWLGNDETHYVRQWEGKELKDLKLTIDLTIRWIEMEEMTKQLINDMPGEEKKENTEENKEVKVNGEHTKSN